MALEESQHQEAVPRRRWLALTVAASLLMGAILTIPEPVTAAPQVLPVSSSAYAVQATDYIVFRTSCSGNTAFLTAPDGNTLEIICAVSEAQQVGNFSLSGQQNGGGGIYQANGNLVGAAGDGTWTLSLRGTDCFYANLTVGGKSFLWDVSPFNPGGASQLWNWRNQTANTTDRSEYGGCNTPTDPPVGAIEDPNNAVFFQDDSGPVQSPLSAFTLHATVSCGTNGLNNTMTVNGAWVGGNGTLFSRYAHRAGDFRGTTDLRSVLGTATTGAENEGNTASGTDADAGVPYNTAAGTSYQFIVNTTGQGEALGVVAYAEPNQCAVGAFDPASNTEHSRDAMVVTVSQSQCQGDASTFTVIMQDNPTGLQEHVLNLYVLDANQGGLNLPPDPREVLFFNTSTMRRTATSDEAHAHYIAAVLPTGNYVAYAYVDYSGVGAVDYVAAEAFSVPRGTCEDTPTNLEPVLLAINATSNALNGSIYATANATQQLIQLQWQDYNTTEAENLAAILANQNITLAQVLAFWADYNGTALQDTAAIIQNITTTATHHEAHFHEFWDDYNATEAANYAGLLAFMQSYWTDYNETEAANLAILWNEHNVTQETLVQFWADYNATALSDMTTILVAIASHDANMTAQHNIMSADLDTIYQAIQELEINVTCTGEGACNFSIDQQTLDDINFTVSTLLAEELNMTAFERVTGLTGLEFAVFPALVLLGIIIWLRSTDYIIRTLGALLVILSGLVWMAVAYYVGFGLVWAGTVPSGIVLMLVGIYMIVRQGWEAFNDSGSMA